MHIIDVSQDVPRNASISHDVFKTLNTNLQELMLKTMKRYNKNSDGHLKPEELRALMRDMAKGDGLAWKQLALLPINLLLFRRRAVR